MQDKFLYMSTDGLIALVKKESKAGFDIITPVELHSIKLPINGDALLTQEDVSNAKYINLGSFIAISEHGDEDGELASVDKMNELLIKQ